MEALLKNFYGWHGFLLIDQGFASHVGWGFAFPAVGYRLAGRKGLIVAAAFWIAYAFFREFVEESWEPTRWSDIVSRCVPSVILLAIEVVQRFRKG